MSLTLIQSLVSCRNVSYLSRGRRSAPQADMDRAPHLALPLSTQGGVSKGAKGRSAASPVYTSAENVMMRP